MRTSTLKSIRKEKKWLLSITSTTSRSRVGMTGPVDRYVITRESCVAAWAQSKIGSRIVDDRERADGETRYARTRFNANEWKFAPHTMLTFSRRPRSSLGREERNSWFFFQAAESRQRCNGMQWWFILNAAPAACRVRLTLVNVYM